MSIVRARVCSGASRGAWRLTAAAVLLTAGLSGCYVESVDDQRDNIRGEKPTTDERSGGFGLDSEIGHCRFNAQTGCFDGHVISKKEFLVEGKAFFNADDLATRFGELITVERLGERLSDDHYKIELLTPMDNPSFLQGFEYYLDGRSVRTGTVRSNGVFNLHNLSEEAYDLRLQKTLKFQVVSTVTKQPVPDQGPEEPGQDEPGQDEHGDDQDGQAESTPAATPTTETVTKFYCATLYTDATIDIRRGERQWQGFNEFRLHVVDRDCPAAGSGRVVTL